MGLFLTKEERKERRIHNIDHSHYRWVVYRRERYFDDPWRWFVLDLDKFPTGKFEIDEYETQVSNKKIPAEKYWVASGGYAGRFNARSQAEDAAREKVAELLEAEGNPP